MAPAGWCVRAALPRLDAANTIGEPRVLTVARAVEFCEDHPSCAGFAVPAAAPRVARCVFFRDAKVCSSNASMVAFVRCEEGAAARSEPPPRVTLTTQLSADRLEALEELSRRWRGPIVAAVLARAGEPPPVLAGSPAHVRLLSFASPRRGEQTYPINQLRNAALRAARTPLVFLCDVDLLPSADLEAELAAVPAAYWATPRLAVVVAAFATTSDALLPDGAAALRACVAAGTCTAFKGGPGIVPGQQLSTNYRRWWSENPEGRALPHRIPCFDTAKYEPYLVVRANATPNFDERFDGYGKNKVQFVQGLRGAGWTFWVLPRAFVIHAPHSLSAAGSQWQHSRTGEHKARMDRLFEQQLADARFAGGHGDGGGCEASTPFCERPLNQVMDMLLPPRAGEPLRAAQPVHIRA